MPKDHRFNRPWRATEWPADCPWDLTFNPDRIPRSWTRDRWCEAYRWLRKRRAQLRAQMASPSPADQPPIVLPDDVSVGFTKLAPGKVLKIEPDVK